MKNIFSKLFKKPESRENVKIEPKEKPIQLPAPAEEVVTDFPIMKIEVTEEEEDLVELTFLLGNIIHAGKSVSCRDIAECVLRAGYTKNNFEKAEFLEILEKDLLNVAHSLGGSAQFRARLEDSFKKLLEKYRGE